MSAIKTITPIIPIMNGNGKHLAPVQPMRFISYDDLMAMDTPPQEWVIDQVIPRGLLSAIVAESGAGKTWLALVMMRNIASGTLWAGKYACKRLTVGYLDLEGDYGRLKDRVRALEAGIYPMPADARPLMHFLSDLGRIDIIEKVGDVIAAVRARGLEVLFVDTLVRVHGYDENSADMSLVMEALERVARDTGCTVVALHHAGKGSNGRPVTGRGSSAIKAALQHEIMLTRQSDRDGVASIKIGLTKAKSAPECDRLTNMAIVPVEGGVGIEFTDEDIAISEPGRPSAKARREADVIKALQDGPLTHTQLMDKAMARAQCGRSTMKGSIAEMLSSGSISQTSDGKYTADCN